MSRRRKALLAVAAASLIAVAGAAGYVLGNRSVPDQHDALVALRDAKQASFKATRDRAVRGGKRTGIEAGRTAARQEASRLGATQGRKAGTLAVASSEKEKASKAPASVLPPATRSPAVSGHGGVLVVGDSLEVLTSPYIKQYLPPGTQLTVNAVGGYSSLQIFDLFKESYDPSQTVIVFDAGTNDDPAYPQILAGRLQAVAQIIGPHRCMVVPTIHGLSVNGINSAGKNRVVQQFAASRPGTQTPDWAGFVTTHPQLMQPDNLHPLPAGANDRAKLIAAGVQGCLASTPLAAAGR